MADLNILKQQLNSYVSTLKETSFDKAKKEYLCNSNKKVYDFDKYKEQNYRDKKSFDALCVENELYCIEFKNQKYGDIKSKDIKEKFNDGLDILSAIFRDIGLNKDYILHFFVVFKDANAMESYKQRFSSDEILFGLDAEKSKRKDFKNLKIQTKTKSEFVKRFKSKL